MSPGLRDSAADTLQELIAEYPRNQSRAPFAREAQPWPLQLSKAADCLHGCKDALQKQDSETAVANLTRMAALALLLAADMRDRGQS